MFISNEKCNKLSDLEIVRMALSDVDYFACLYDRYESRLLRYINTLVSVSHEDAADILQDSFIKVWRNLNAFDTDMKVSSWVYRIVHNETISFGRKRKSYGKDRQVDLADDVIEEISNDTEELNEDDKDLADKLTHELLEQLPFKYKTVLILKFIEGMRYEDISDILKIPEGTVAIQISRAKKMFSALASAKHISFTK